MIGWGHGHGVIMDKHYRIVKSIEPASYQASSDMHEFMVINDGKSALMTQYLRSAYDLCQFDLCDGFGYIQQGAFQEIDVETGQKLFEWRSLDHVGVDESFVLPGTTEISGSGEHPESPWDYFHINSIDKNADGDYLISARHVSAVYKISGKDGHVIWRLHGKKSDYYLDGFSFSSQHDARWVSDDENESVISMFDNGSNGFNQTHDHSMLKIIRLNHNTKIATIDLNLDPPCTDGHCHISKSQGSFQLLPNGNYLAGWGNDAFWTEYAGDNHDIVFYGALGWTNVMNYRVHKFDNWVGMPLTTPAMWTYSKYGQHGNVMYLYMSWNGATEVRHWRLFGSQSKSGPWDRIAIVPRNGFESILRHNGFYLYAYAEALDKNFEVLGTTEIQTTFVPTDTLREYCDEIACRFMPSPEERRREREKEQQEEEEKEKKAAAARKKHQKQVREAVTFGSVFGGLALILLVIATLATRNFVSIPVNTFAKTSWEKIKRRKQKASLGHYKALTLQDNEGDRTPMILDGS